VTICNDVNELINKNKDNKEEDLYIAGGRTIYSLFLPYCEELIISHINKEYKGNVYFPDYKESDFTSYKEEKYNDFKVVYYKKNN
jgi:dihydrofolate reductase